MSALRPILPADGAALPERIPRTNLCLSVELTVPGEPVARVARLRNLSIEGAGIEHDDPPPVGTTLVLRRGAEEIAAEVMWRADDACGLRFTAPIEVLRWMGERSPAILHAKTAEPSLADDLALVRTLLGRIEDGLADHPLLPSLLPVECQAIDLALQLLRVAEARCDGRPATTGASVRRAARDLLSKRPRPAA